MLIVILVRRRLPVRGRPFLGAVVSVDFLVFVVLEVIVVVKIVLIRLVGVEFRGLDLGRPRLVLFRFGGIFRVFGILLHGRQIRPGRLCSPLRRTLFHDGNGVDRTLVEDH